MLSQNMIKKTLTVTWKPGFPRSFSRKKPVLKWTSSFFHGPYFLPVHHLAFGGRFMLSPCWKQLVWEGEVKWNNPLAQVRPHKGRCAYHPSHMGRHISQGGEEPQSLSSLKAEWQQHMRRSPFAPISALDGNRNVWVRLVRGLPTLTRNYVWEIWRF